MLLFQQCGIVSLAQTLVGRCAQGVISSARKFASRATANGTRNYGNKRENKNDQIRNFLQT
jgi:hypothetical protein